MYKITFSEFEHIMLYDISCGEDPCIEINFIVDGCTKHQDCCMGKLTDQNTKCDVYWFGLVPDGSQAHDFDSFKEFVDAKVFYGNRSLKELWDSISISLFGGGAVAIYEVRSYILNLEKHRYSLGVSEDGSLSRLNGGDKGTVLLS